MVSPILCQALLFVTELQVTLTREAFMNIPNVLICCGQLHCGWGKANNHTVGHVVLQQNPAPIPTPVLILKEVVRPEKASQAPSEWTTVVKNGAKVTAPPPQKVVAAPKLQQ